MYLYSRLNKKQTEGFRAFCLSQHHHRIGDVGLAPDSKVLAFGAHSRYLPYGLAMADIDASGQAELLALYVRDDHRRKRLATELMSRIVRELEDRRCRAVRALYELGRPYSESLSGFLEHEGFSQERYATACRCLWGGMRDAAFLQRLRVPSAFELFPWADLTEAERQRILARQREAPWYPEDLSPFARVDFEPLNSLGLRHHGEVVGWQINHRIADDTIQYSITFVREDLQPLGLGVLLMVESTRLHAFSSDLGTKAYFRVPYAMTGMMQYIESRLAPYIDERNECVKATKVLRPEGAP